MSRKGGVNVALLSKLVLRAVFHRQKHCLIRSASWHECPLAGVRTQMRPTQTKSSHCFKVRCATHQSVLFHYPFRLYLNGRPLSVDPREGPSPSVDGTRSVFVKIAAEETSGPENQCKHLGSHPSKAGQLVPRDLHWLYNPNKPI